MQNNIRNTNLRFNLDKEQQRRAWEYLQTMDRQDFKSYSQVISLAPVSYTHLSTAKNIISALWDVAFTHRDIRLL